MKLKIENSNEIKKIFESFKIKFEKFNWLLTDIDCSYTPDRRFNEKAIWISGTDLLKLFKKYNDLQFYWGVFSAFPPEVKVELPKESDLPFADGNEDIWEPTGGPQHQDAILELISWDSTHIIFSSKDDDLLKQFRSLFKKAEKL